jgi:hypothetical protein
MLQVADEILKERKDAVQASYLHPNDGAARAAFWRSLNPGSATADVAGHISYWAAHFNKYGHVLDLRQPGRTPRISDEAARKAVYLFAVDKYETLQAAARDVPYIRELLARTGVSAQMLLRRMQQVEPALGRWRHTDNRKDLSAEELSIRPSMAKQLYKKGDAFQDRVIYIDCKTVSIKGLGGPKKLVWGIKRKPFYPNVIIRKKGYTQSGCSLRWYSGVNKKVGWVFIKFVTGTSPLKKKNKYQVTHLATKPSASVEKPITIMLW